MHTAHNQTGKASRAAGISSKVGLISSFSMDLRHSNGSSVWRCKGILISANVVRSFNLLRKTSDGAALASYTDDTDSNNHTPPYLVGRHVSFDLKQSDSYCTSTTYIITVIAEVESQICHVANGQHAFENRILHDHGKSS